MSFNAMRYFLAGPLVAMVSLAGSVPDSLADVYRYVDAAGVAHYTNQQSSSDSEGYTAVVLLVEEVGLGNRAHAEPDSRNVLKFSEHVGAAASAHQLDEALLHAVITVESGYNPRAVSPKGAIGLMQLMPATAKRLAVADPYDPQQNIYGGARYLRLLLDLFGGSMELALAAYNAGEGAVIRHGKRIPPYAETLAYVPKVLRIYEKIKRK